MTDLEGKPGLSNFIIDIDAGRAPHNNLFGLIALEELDGVIRHAAGRGRIVLLMVDDPPAVRRATYRDVVEPEAVENCGDGLNHVEGAEDIATEVENDPVALAVLRQGGRTPLRLLRHVGQVADDRDLVTLPRGC
jgi:hypothetical protein